MKDYAKELMGVWTNGGEQEAFDRAAELLREIKVDIANAQREYAAIEALIAVLRNRPGVNVAEESTEPEDGLDTILPELRRKYIIDAANTVLRQREESNLVRWESDSDDIYGVWRVTTSEVLQDLEDQGLSLGVQQPHAVIGTVLANAEGFERIARNTFEKRFAVPSRFQGPTTPDDLPF